MCGIVGFITNSQFEVFSHALPTAVASLAHRGPDDAGVFTDAAAAVGLGHRRLSILDITPSGHQPMSSDDGTVQIVYNGEIYNFAALRADLESAGRHFKSRSDTEVVLKAYLEWGYDCLNRFNGMFALAIWDGRCRELLLARDRVGIKPLYYYLSGENLIFASELKAILAFDGVSGRINPDALPLYLHYQYIPAPHTIYRSMFKLLPGHCLRYASGDVHITSWNALSEIRRETSASDGSNLNMSDASGRSLSRVLDGLQDVLIQTVSTQMVSDAPIGALLSGGVDSSLITALMQHESASPVRTFSIGFQDAGYDEAPWAACIARYLGTRHTELYVRQKDALAVIPALPMVYDEPFADASALASVLVHRLAGSQVKVALSGDGGDEQFCGYTRYWATRKMMQWRRYLPHALRKGIYAVLSQAPPDAVAHIYRLLHPALPKAAQTVNFPEKWQKLLAQMDAADIQALYRASVCVWDRTSVQRLTGRFPQSGRFERCFSTAGWPVMSALLRVDQQTYLPDAMLVKVDRASMASALEVRVPFLDNRVAAFASRLPESWLYKDGQGKYILRKLLSRYLPDSLFDRPKAGFAVPVSKWLRGELRPMLLDYLSYDRLKREGIFNPAVVSAAVSDHLSGRVNHPHRLWALMMWELWRDAWL